MLGMLPKLADKAFVLGFLLPVFAFCVSGLALFSEENLLDKLAQKDALEFVYLALLVWGLAVFMMMLNHMEYRILEGYSWPFSKLTWLKDRQLREFRDLTTRLGDLEKAWELLGNKFPIEKEAEYASLQKRFISTFPDKEELVLPTRFGNAIRAFESYSRVVYGADSIPLWLHLATVIPKDFQTALEDARAQVNCLVNLCFFAILIGLMAVFRFVQSVNLFGAISSSPLSIDVVKLLPTKGLDFLLIMIGSAVITRVTYELSIERIHGWGALVKAAFDCFLPALACRMGYRLPTTGEAQMAFWTAVSQRAIFHSKLKPEEWLRADEKRETKGSLLEDKGNEGEDDEEGDDDGRDENNDGDENEDVMRATFI
jgi:hypothetical protein